MPDGIFASATTGPAGGSNRDLGSVNRTAQSELQLVSASGRALKVSIPTVGVAREVFRRAEEADEPSARRRARYKGMIDGNPPFDAAKLRELNLGYQTNVNFREMKAILDQKAGSFFELFMEVPTLAEFQFIAPPGETATDQPRDRWEDVVSEEFTRTLRSWPGFLTLMDQCRRESDAFDFGLAMWRDPWDWRPTAIQRSCFLPEPHARVEVDSWNLACFSDTMTGYELLEIAENEDAAVAEQWNVAAVRRLLVSHFVSQARPGTDQGSPAYAAISVWERFQQQIRNNEPSTISRMFDPIQVRHIFAREPLSRKISHLIFSPDVVGDDTEDFLCERRDLYTDMHEVVWCLPYNWGDGFLKGVRGLAAELEPHCDLSNRYLGRLFDAGMMAGTVLLKPTSDLTDVKRLQLVRVGLLTMLPRGTDAIQSATFSPPLAPLVQIRDLSVSIMRNNTGVWRQHSEGWAENQPEKSARQVAEESSKEARLDKANVAFDYIQLERLYREIFRRLTNPELLADRTLPGAEEAAAFVERCLAREVPEQFLNPASLTLNATQAIGMGSWGVRLDIARQILEGRELFDEHGKVNAIRDWLAALAGQRNINRYKAPKNRDQIASNETSIARLENNDLSEGSSVVVGTDQNHAIHFLEVAGLLNQLVTEIQQSGGASIQDPQKTISVLENSLTHATEHLSILAADPARAAFVEQAVPLITAAKETLDFVSSMAEQLAKEQQRIAEEQQAQLAEAQGIIADRDKQLEEMKAMEKLRIESDKQASIVDMRKKKADETSAINQSRAASDQALKAQKQQVELELKRQLAEGKAAIDRMVAEAKAATAGARGSK